MAAVPLYVKYHSQGEFIFDQVQSQCPSPYHKRSLLELPSNSSICVKAGKTASSLFKEASNADTCIFCLISLNDKVRDPGDTLTPPPPLLLPEPPCCPSTFWVHRMIELGWSIVSSWNALLSQAFSRGTVYSCRGGKGVDRSISYPRYNEEH